jgi:hypothetical protein
MTLALEILKQKVRRVDVVGLDAAHPLSSEHHQRGMVLAEPLLHRQRVDQIELSAAWFELLVVDGAHQDMAARADH